MKLGDDVLALFSPLPPEDDAAADTAAPDQSKPGLPATPRFLKNEVMKKAGGGPDPFWKEAPLVDESEIFSELHVKRGSSLFLGRYSANEIMAVLNKKGFLKEARQRFLWPLTYEYELDSSDYPLQRLQIFLREPGPENVIVDVKVKECDFVPKEAAEGLPVLPPQKALAFEWLTLQNPLVKRGEPFSPLPGQTRPGLSMRSKIMDLFVYLGRLTHKDCLLAFPAYFHNGVLFSRYFHFWNPRKEAEVLAIRRSSATCPSASSLGSST